MRTAPFVLFVVVAALGGCSRGAPTSAPTDAAPPAPQSDKDKLQGVWAVESADSGNPNVKPREDITIIRFQFRGDRVETGAGGKFFPYVSFVLDETANPKVLKATHLGPDGQSHTRPAGSALQAHPHEWIYKFEGDALVIAKPDWAVFTEKPPARPADFVGKPYQPGTGGVVVMRLKKTDEPVTEPAPRPTPVGTKK